MAESKRDKLMSALDKFLFGDQKFAEIKVGDKTYTYTGAENFGVGVDMKDCPDGDYQTDTHQFTVKSGKVIDYKEKTVTPAPTVDIAAEMKAQLKKQADTYEEKFASQKTEFDAAITALKAEVENTKSKIDTLVAGKLKEIFDIVTQIADSPSAPSQFKKKDGEPTPQGETAFERARKEAKEISKKVFNN